MICSRPADLWMKENICIQSCKVNCLFLLVLSLCGQQCALKELLACRSAVTVFNEEIIVSRGLSPGDLFLNELLRLGVYGSNPFLFQWREGTFLYLASHVLKHVLYGCCRDASRSRSFWTTNCCAYESSSNCACGAAGIFANIANDGFLISSCFMVSSL